MRDLKMVRLWMPVGRVILLVALVAIAVLPGSPVVLALDPTEQLKDAKLESRARELSAELRCLVCQNQSIDDSDAPLAKDLRLLVRERLVAGDSNVEVKQFLVQRYGDFVLLKPPFGLHTLLLWLTPALVLAATLAYVLRAMRHGKAPVAAKHSGLTADEEKRLSEVLGCTASPERDAGNKPA